MKPLATLLHVGVAAAAWSPFQQILKPSHEPSESWAKQLVNFEKSLKTLSREARLLWDQTALMYPEAMNKANFFSLPKKHTRRPDSAWDHIIKGSDIQKVWVQNEHGEKERDVDGKLESYSLRTKRVDPSSLGVDPSVRQYSGYLDNDEDDKHLFYCKCRPDLITPARLAHCILKGFSNLATTQKMTQLFSGSTVVQDARRSQGFSSSLVQQASTKI